MNPPEWFMALMWPLLAIGFSVVTALLAIAVVTLYRDEFRRRG